MIEIKNRFNGNTIFESEANSVSEVVLEAIRKYVSLGGADLSGADLSGAYLSGANLSGANGSELAIAMTRILPAGTLIGWKKCRDGVIVKLEIPSEAGRSHAFGRKCRAEFARVLEVIGAETGISHHDSNFIYRSGEMMRPKTWDTNWDIECAGGVHFFITREEAEAYTF